MDKSKLEDRVIPNMAAITPITGSSTINHNARVKMELKMDEYVLIDLIERLHRDAKPLEYTTIYEKIGLTHDEVKPMIQSLWERGFIETCKAASKFKPSNKWSEAFSSVKNEFEEFWHYMEFSTENGKKRVAWTGSKIDAFNKFAKIRKIESFDYLMGQKIAYFKVIATSDYRQVMGCPVFLNENTKRYSENWSSQITNGIIREEVKKRKVTKEEVRKQF